MSSPRIATFSIAATDGTDWGVAVASKFLAVGAAVPAAASGSGAIATQALANTSYKVEGLRLLSSGVGAQDVVEQLTGADEGRDHRQLGVVDRSGGAATYTGSACFDWAGGKVGPGCACQGNILAGEAVVDALLDQFRSSGGSLASRLLRALEAGDMAGGDRRGRQSAAILVVRAGAGYGGFDDRMVDLRVDDHETPIPELVRLVDLWRVHFEEPDASELLPLDAEVVERLRQALFSRGLVAAGAPREQTLDAFQAWAGMENLEQRCQSRDLIDPLVLRVLAGELKVR